MKILVVEDSELEQARLEVLLQRLDHDVVLASNGLDALETYAVCKPDLVLLDVMMPVMGGLEAARRLRALPVPWTPIVFLSGNIEPEDIAAGIEAGGDDYLHKPVNAIVLAAKLLAMQRIVHMQSLMAQANTPTVRAGIADLAAVDAQTGVASAGEGMKVLNREFMRCSRSGQSVSVLVVGIDNYVALSERYGREAAEQCARNLVMALQSNASRMSDFIASEGHGKFRIVMPETPMTGAVRVAERIRQTIGDLTESETLGDDGRRTVPCAFTISAGVATVIPRKESDSATLLGAAENMLAQAQQEGGDRVHAAAADVPFRLTARELECLQWSAVGKSSWEISSILGISESAVNFHMANIRSKFDVGSRRQAVVQAIHFGLIRAG